MEGDMVEVCVARPVAAGSGSWLCYAVSVMALAATVLA